MAERVSSFWILKWEIWNILMQYKHGIILSTLSGKPQLSPSSLEAAGRICPEVKETPFFLLKSFLLHKCSQVCKSTAFQNTETQAGNRTIKNKLNIAQKPEIINEITEAKFKQMNTTVPNISSDFSLCCWLKFNWILSFQFSNNKIFWFFY